MALFPYLIRRAFGTFLIGGLVVGGLYLFGTGLDAYWLKHQAQTWSSTQGQVRSSSMETLKGLKSTTYRPILAYTYQVGGIDYVGTMARFGPQTGSLEEIQWMLRTFPLGATPEVFINPTDPRSSVLDRSDVSVPANMGILGGALLALFGSIALIIHWRYLRSQKTSRLR